MRSHIVPRSCRPRREAWDLVFPVDGHDPAGIGLVWTGDAPVRCHIGLGGIAVAMVETAPGRLHAALPLSPGGTLSWAVYPAADAGKAALYLRRGVWVEKLFERQYGPPTGDEASPTTGETTLEPERLAAHDVLVVDDEESARRSLQRALEARGYHVDLAASGRDAVTALRSRRYQAVVVDCEMPLMDGYETTRRIRRHDLTTPIIAIADRANPSRRTDLLRSGMDDYLPKPPDPDRLDAVIRRLSGQG